MRGLGIMMVFGAIIGAIVGLFWGGYFGFLAAKAHIGADALASGLGSVFGAIATVLGIHFLDVIRIGRSAAPHSIVIIEAVREAETWLRDARTVVDFVGEAGAGIESVPALAELNLENKKIRSALDATRQQCLSVPNSMSSFVDLERFFRLAAQEIDLLGPNFPGDGERQLQRVRQAKDAFSLYEEKCGAAIDGLLSVCFSYRN